MADEVRALIDDRTPNESRKSGGRNHEPWIIEIALNASPSKPKLHVRDVIYISSSARQYIGETGDRSPSSAAQKSAQLGIRLTYGDVRR